MKTKTLIHLFISGLFCAVVITSLNTIAFTENSAKEQVKASAKEDANDSLSFKWAIFHKDKKNNIAVLDFTKKPTVHSGDKLKIYIEPLKGVFLYVYLYDSQKRLSPLFSLGTDTYKAGKTYYIPDEEGWFTLDANTGAEMFYLIASKNRLTDLERLTVKYTSAPLEKKNEVKLSVLAEIKNVRQRFSKLTTTGEKPVPIAGVFRGLKPGTRVIQVEADTFYGKTLRLEHK